jgi:hypothetical protein
VPSGSASRCQQSCTSSSRGDNAAKVGWRDQGRGADAFACVTAIDGDASYCLTGPYQYKSINRPRLCTRLSRTLCNQVNVSGLAAKAVRQVAILIDEQLLIALIAPMALGTELDGNF